MPDEYAGERPRRVLQVIASVADKYGGPSVGSLQLNAALRLQGVEATIITTSYALSEAEEESVRFIRGADVALHQPSRPYRLLNSWGAVRDIFVRSGACDVIHIHGQYLMLNIAAFLVSLYRGVPYGVQLHGALEPYQRRKSVTAKAVYEIVLGRVMLRRASYLQCASQEELENVRAYVPNSTCILVPLGIAPPDQRAQGQVFRDSRRRLTVLFLGRLTVKKQLFLLVRAWRATDRPVGSRLVIAGASGDISVNELKKYVVECGVSDSVEVVGPVHGEEKEALYEKCGIFVQPSLNENFGLTVPEAMSHACHVIASRNVASSLYLKEAGAGQVLESCTERTLSSALEDALKDPTVVQVSGKLAREFALANLTWHSSAACLIRHWNSLSIPPAREPAVQGVVLGTNRKSTSSSRISVGEKARENIDLLMSHIRRRRERTERYEGLLDEVEAYEQFLHTYSGRSFADSRVFEIGYGARPFRLEALLARGVDAEGIDLDAPVLGGSLEEYARVLKVNGLERAAKTLVRRVAFDRSERIAFESALRKRGWTSGVVDRGKFYVGHVVEAPVEDSSINLVFSEDVFEHIDVSSIHSAVEAMWRWLEPNGLALIRPNIFTGIIGGHLVEWDRWAAGELPFERISTRPWEHLRADASKPNSDLNQLTRQDYRRIFASKFDILAEEIKRPQLGAEFLDETFGNELANYGHDELFSNQVLFVLRPRK